MTKPDKQERAAALHCPVMVSYGQCRLLRDHFGPHEALAAQPEPASTPSTEPTPPVDVEGLVQKIWECADGWRDTVKMRALLTAAFADVEKRLADTQRHLQHSIEARADNTKRIYELKELLAPSPCGVEGHCAKDSTKAWRCVNCKTLSYAEELELSTASCKCGIGEGRWVFEVVCRLCAELEERERAARLAQRTEDLEDIRQHSILVAKLGNELIASAIAAVHGRLKSAPLVRAAHTQRRQG